MTLLDIQKSCFRRLGFADTPDTAVTTRLTMFLNERYRALLTSPALRQLRDGFGQFDSVASQAEYGLPFGIARITAIRETVNQRTLGLRSWEWYRQRDPNPASDQGTPDAWVPIGMRAVFRRPAGTGVWAVSSSAADTTQVVSSLVGRADSQPRGSQQAFTTTLTGTTRVQIGNGLYDDVFTLSVSAVTAGAVSFFDAVAGGNLIAVLPAGRRISHSYVIALVPTPASVATYSIDYEAEVTDLANAWDEPLLPSDFHDLLVHAVLLDELLHRDDSRYAAAEAQYNKRLRELKIHLYGHRIACQPRAAAEVAPLGPWFPRQSW